MADPTLETIAAQLQQLQQTQMLLQALVQHICEMSGFAPCAPLTESSAAGTISANAKTITVTTPVLTQKVYTCDASVPLASFNFAPTYANYRNLSDRAHHYSSVSRPVGV